MASFNGESFGKYKILSSIGAGGMGKLYLAQDTELDRNIAIKFLSEEFSNDSEKLNRFVQEAKATSAINHPNILSDYVDPEIFKLTFLNLSVRRITEL